MGLRTLAARFSRPLGLAVVVAIALGPSAAFAQSKEDLKRAELRFKEADQLEKAGDCAGAIVKFNEVLKVKETPQVRLRIGICQEGLGHLAEARAEYEKSLALAKAVGNAQVETYVKDKLDALVANLPKIKVDLGGRKYPELRVELDSAKLDASALGTEITVYPGDHQLVAEAPGWKRSERVVQVSAKGVVTVKLALTPEDVAAPPDSGPKQPLTEPPPSKALPIVLLVAGAGAIGAGVAFFVVAGGKSSDVDTLCGGADRLKCPASKKDEIDSKVASIDLFHGISLAAGAAGLVSAGVGVFLLARAPKSHAATEALAKPTFQVTPVPWKDGGGVLVRGRF